MKKMITSVLAICAFSVQAAELTSFADVAAAVSEGKQISFVMNAHECTSEKPMPTLTGFVKPNAVIVVGNNRITASDRHFTMDDPVARGTPIFDYSKYIIDSEGKATINITVLNAIDYSKISNFQINCELGKGFKVFG